MEIRALRTPIIEKGQNLFEAFRDAVGGPLHERDIVCVTSKIVSMEQGRVKRLSEVQPSPKARQMKKLRYSKDFGAHPELAELVIQEADVLFEGEDGFVYLTLKNNILIANAGIDLSNACEGHAILWPDRPWEWARDFRSTLQSHYHVADLGVVVTDSHLTPLRRGVTGVAIAYSGFEGIQSEIGKPDLFGKPLRITEKAVADDLASVAVLLMGEAGESTPFALIREAPVIFTGREIDPKESFIPPTIDLYAGIYNQTFRTLLDGPTQDFPGSKVSQPHLPARAVDSSGR